LKKKPDRKWVAILVLMTGMAWAAGSMGSYQKSPTVKNHWTEKS
jgi:hypothetical protein